MKIMTLGELFKEAIQEGYVYSLNNQLIASIEYDPELLEALSEVIQKISTATMSIYNEDGTPGYLLVTYYEHGRTLYPERSDTPVFVCDLSDWLQ